jgi:LysM repeat protein
MKTLAFALIAAFLLASQVITPAAAASSSTELASVNCGDTYVVQPLDYLVRIASYCGTTVANILALNPQIVNPSLVYSGQVLRLTTNVPIPYWPTYNLNTTTYNTYNTYTTYNGYARVSLSTTQAYAGAAVTVYASGFPANAQIDFRVGLQGAAFSLVYDGTTASDGTASQTVIIPAGAIPGQYWTVQVVTTGLKDVVSVYSTPIYIPGYSYYTNYTSYYPSVSLSTTQAVAGGTVSVYVSGFPANANIDFRVGLQGEHFSLVYDGLVDAYGSTNQTITIPTGATAGQYWVVLVTTTEMKDITQVTSHTIYITN